MENRLIQLRQFITEHYNLEELRTLCFDLGINFDDLRGETLSGKAGVLILELGHRRELHRLLAALQKDRTETYGRAEFGADAATLYPELSTFEAEIYPPSLEGGPQWLIRIVSRARRNVLLTVLVFLALLFPVVWIGATGVLPMLRPASRKPMDGTWNIAVARFTSVGDKSISRESAELLSRVFYKQLELDISDVSDELKIPILLWGPEETGAVTGDTPEERESSAEELARSINAHMIIYGSVQRVGDSLHLQPEFYVRLEASYEAQELVGKYAFGGGINIVGNEENLPSQIGLNRELSRRAEALALIARGLTFYTTHRYEEALEWFEQANEEKHWEHSDEGREVVYQFQGNAAGALLLLKEAEEAYNASIEVEREYARAYAGLGGIYFNRSIEHLREQDGSATGGAFEADRELLDRALDYFERALKAKIQPSTADIPAKVAFGRGQVYTAQWFTDHDQDTLEQARKQFGIVIEQYGNGENPRLQEFAAEAHAILGQIEREVGDAEAAIQRYLTAQKLSTSPSRRGLFSANLAIMYARLGQVAEAEKANRKAIDEFKLALGLTYNDELEAEYWGAIATRYECLGEVDEAIKALEQAMDLLPAESKKRDFYQSQLDEMNTP